MKYLIILIFMCNYVLAQENTEALLELGVGFGYVHFEHYPAADQYASLALPFPTFQYRGEILRADDREGTRAYLLKNNVWSLEFSGGGVFALDASDNEARRDMPNLPWMIHLGPQVVGEFSDNMELRVGFFQAVSTDFSYTKTNGGVLDSKLMYQRDSEFIGKRNHTFIASILRFATKDYLETYFQVPHQYVTPSRPYFEAKNGFLGHEIQFFHAIKFGRTAVYAGASMTDYSASVNRGSPLHKSNMTVGYLVGITYLLHQSQRNSVPLQSTEGIINKQRDKH